ncbi:hypothetical protein HPB52_007885 [Rhipicephalus sanguineus]|uniref:Uncharacterized protein n=1 Tax=Rhipicephalus sanguineus TaxID=34632 RepID=A0A9D4SVW0_RHISA|nr:hypothetical protein HPB52_007885 [Rhipicephalus sanguineus]
MFQTPPVSCSTSPVLVNPPVHRAMRRIRGLTPEVDDTVPTALTDTTSDSVQTARTGTESAMSNRYTLESPRFPTTFHGTEREDVDD